MRPQQHGWILELKLKIIDVSKFRMYMEVLRVIALCSTFYRKAPPRRLNKNCEFSNWNYFKDAKWNPFVMKYQKIQHGRGTPPPLSQIATLICRQEFIHRSERCIFHHKRKISCKEICCHPYAYTRRTWTSWLLRNKCEFVIHKQHWQKFWTLVILQPINSVIWKSDLRKSYHHYYENDSPSVSVTM